jgi:hypothetical protein
MAIMSGEPKTENGILFKRTPVIVRSWDGPNSRIGLEMDLSQMPWGPFDALGKRLSLLLPASENLSTSDPAGESQVERALRHVEHAEERCAEFARLANGNQELWLRSQETWEWVRKYLTSLWVETELEGKAPPDLTTPPGGGGQSEPESLPLEIPHLPGAAATLQVAARVLKATPLSSWREAIGVVDPGAPTREEAVQTLLGVAGILGGQAEDSGEGLSVSHETAPAEVPEASPPVEADPDQLSFEFARGYDEGYQMGRRVGLALGARKSSP